MARQVPVDASASTDGEERNGTRQIAPDLAYQRLAIVNVVFFGAPGAGDRGWVLIDAGVAGVGAKNRIRRAAASRFGKDARPAAIIMTHGHFDHVGALEDLSDLWDAPVYAHELEHPYLDGRASYPPPDPTVGGGLMSALSGMYPRGPVDVGSRLHRLPSSGAVPEMPGWTWLHTPGHTPGHISLWRESDRALIAGDAFITTRQESAYSVATQSPELHGPPMYYTQDWAASRTSVERLSGLDPELVITGHGPAMRGEPLRDALRKLAAGFDQVAVPEGGRYVKTPARPGAGAYRTRDSG